MLPAVAEVVRVKDAARACLLDRLDQRGPVSGLVLHAEVVKFRIADFPCHAFGFEHVEMAVQPTHGGLQGLVQPIKAHIRRNLQGAGNRWFDVLEQDFDFDNLHVFLPAAQAGSSAGPWRMRSGM